MISNTGQLSWGGLSALMCYATQMTDKQCCNYFPTMILVVKTANKFPEQKTDVTA